MKPHLLDLFCCQGGASAGYTAAGFTVTGVDINPQPRYPYPFTQADAITVLHDLIRSPVRAVDAVHASPPCQAHSRGRRLGGRDHPDLITDVRDLLADLGVPYVIENVYESPLLDPVELCGSMFGLRTYRHRLFESNVALSAPRHELHQHTPVKMGRAVTDGDWYHAVGNFPNVAYVRRDLGLPWMSRDGLRECVPPAYTRHVGHQLLTHLGRTP